MSAVRRGNVDGVNLVDEAGWIDAGLADRVRLDKRVEPVRNTRNIGKADMVHNDKLPKIEVDPETYTVKADGELLTCEPATELPLAQRYFLF